MVKFVAKYFIFLGGCYCKWNCFLNFIFQFFIAHVYKYNRFCILILCPQLYWICSLLLIVLYFFFFLLFSIYKIMLSADRDWFYFFSDMQAFSFFLFFLSLLHKSSRACGLSCPRGKWDLFPRPGIEPMPPVLEGGFLTAGPPGKSPSFFFYILA